MQRPGGFGDTFLFNLAKTIPQIAHHSLDSTPAVGIKKAFFFPLSSSLSPVWLCKRAYDGLWGMPLMP